MSANHRSNTWWNRVRAFFINVPIKDTEGRVIDVKPWPTGVLEDGSIMFEKEYPENLDNPEHPYVKADVVVFATGYSRSTPFLDMSYGPPCMASVRGCLPNWQG